MVNLSFILLISVICASKAAENLNRDDASMIEELAKLLLTKLTTSGKKTFVVTRTDGSPATPTNPPITRTSDSEKIRLCSCFEVDKCISDAYRHISSCRSSCKSHLEYYGSKTEEYVECFPKSRNASDVLAACFKTEIPNFCSPDSARPFYIAKLNYTEVALAASSNASGTFFNLDNLVEVTAIESIRQFYACTDLCLKNHFVSCFERKPCGVHVYPGFDLGNPMSFCSAHKNAIYQSAMKAAPCIAAQRFISKLLN